MPPASERSKHSGIGEVFKTLTKPFKPAPGRVPVVVNAKVVGGGSEMPRLLHLLRCDSLAARVEAANEISKLIQKISISSTTEIWYLARDMCLKDLPPAVRRSGLRVLVECIKKYTDSTGDKLSYYKDIISFCDISIDALDPDFDLFLEALVQLTDNGKDLHDLNIYNLDQSWSEFMLKNLELASKDMSLFKTDTAKSRDFTALIQLIEYLTRCLKFNFVLVSELFVLSVLDKVIFMCFNTENSMLLLKLTQFVNTVTVFGQVPSSSQLATVKLLCWLSYYSVDYHEISRESLVKISNECPSDTLLNIVSILQDPTLQEARSKTFTESDLQMIPHNAQRGIVTAFGAIGSLEHLILTIGAGDSVHKNVLPFHQIYSSITESRVSDVPILNTRVLRLFERLLSQTCDTNTHLPAITFSVIFPFHLWCLSSDSLLDLLVRLNLNSAQDQEYWAVICLSILSKFMSNGIAVTKDRLVMFYLQKPQRILKAIAHYILHSYEDSKACVTPNPHWKENCGTLLRAFYYSDGGTSNSSEVRIKTLEVLYQSFDFSVAFYNDYSIGIEFLIEVVRGAKNETDPDLIEYIFQSLLFDMMTKFSLEFLRDIISIFEPLFLGKPNKSRLKSIVSLGSFPSPTAKGVRSIKSDRDGDSNTLFRKVGYLRELAKVLCKSLLTLSLHKPEEAKLVYEFMIVLGQASISDEEYEVTLILVRALIRMRCSVEGYIYFCQPADMEGLATAMNRNTLIDTFEPSESHQWCYPESLPYLPSETYNKPSRNLKIFNSTTAKLPFPKMGTATLEISKWLTLVSKITEEYYDWELYSFVWAHFCSQLCNMSLFEGCESFILNFRKAICDQLSLNLPPLLSFPVSNNNIAKADLLVAFIRTLSSLMGYHHLFNKQEEDHIINSLLSSLASWEKTAIPSIHLLTICCYELPQSMKKYLIPILTRLQTSLTSASASSHTLEFLMALIQVPTLTSNFTIDEFKRVFAITFRYIEHAMDMKSRKDVVTKSEEGDSARIQNHGVDAQIDRSISTQKTKVTPMLHQYLLTISFEVMAQWFLRMKLEDRSQMTSFIVKNIISCCGASKFSELDDVTIAHLDFVARFTYSNIPLSLTQLKKQVFEPHVFSNRWIIGQAIVGIDTNITNGDSTITLRRPTGLTVLDVKLNSIMLANIADLETAHPLFASNRLLLQLFGPLDQESHSNPIPLLDDAASERAVSILDRVPVISPYKAGIVYIGPGQHEESEILANSVGSEDYHQFLGKIGHMIKLSDAGSIYLGDLDKENGTDGEFAYFWGDELTQLIFHTTTLMPTMYNDKLFLMKKRHIGNNHVNVFFDESGLPFNFNIIRSQFNFINIVISPHTISCNGGSHHGFKYYKVKTYRRSEVPGIFSTSHYKLVSLELLPYFIRDSVLMANRFARIWHGSVDGVYVTNWELRVRQLRALRERALAAHQALHQDQKNSDDQNAPKSPGGGTDAASANMIQSFLEQLQASTTTVVNSLLSTAGYELPSSSDKELHDLLEFNSYTF